MPLQAQSSVDKEAMRILRDECISCHRPGKAKGGLLLHDPEKLAAGGDSGPALIVGKPHESFLVEVLHADGDPHMPPKKQLSKEQIATLQNWIEQGAKWDASVFDEAPPTKVIATAPLPTGYHPIFTLNLSPDGSKLAVTRGDKLILLNAGDAKYPVIKQTVIPVAPVSSLTWSDDGKHIYIGSVQRVFQWNWETNEQPQLIVDGLLGPIQALAFESPQALWIGDGPIAGAGFIRKLDPVSKKILSTFKAHEDLIYSLVLSKDKKSILSCSADKYVKRWDIQTGKVQAIYEGHTNHVLAATYNHDGSQIASASSDREVKLWNTETKLQEGVLGNKKYAYADLDWSRDGKLLAVITDNGSGNLYFNFVKHTGVQTSRAAEQRSLAAVKETLSTCAFSADGKFLFGGSASGKLYVWDTANGRLVNTLLQE